MGVHGITVGANGMPRVLLPGMQVEKGGGIAPVISSAPDIFIPKERVDA